jgi:hypothetical protein
MLILKLFFISTLDEDGNNFLAFWGAIVFKFSALSNPLYVSTSSDDCLINIIRPF